MTERLLSANIFFSLLAGIGLWLVYAGIVRLLRHGPEEKLLKGLGGARANQGLTVTALPPLFQRAFGPLMYDLGGRLFGSSEQAAQRVEDRLRRSGWLYVSVGDYYASKMATAVMLAVGAAAMTLFLGQSPLVIAVAALAMGLIGMLLPDNKLSDVTRKRKDSLYREMAYTIDRLAVVLRTGLNLGPAMTDFVSLSPPRQRTVAEARVASAESKQDLDWVSSGRGGLFVAMLRDLSNAIAMNQDIEAAVGEVRATVPLGMPQVEEFLELVKSSVKEGMGEIAPQLEALGRTMRDDLNNRIEERAQATELKVVMITAATIVPAMLIIVIGAAAAGFASSGLLGPLF
jgi:hypothetical protein